MAELEEKTIKIHLNLNPKIYALLKQYQKENNIPTITRAVNFIIEEDLVWKQLFKTDLTKFENKMDKNMLEINSRIDILSKLIESNLKK